MREGWGWWEDACGNLLTGFPCNKTLTTTITTKRVKICYLPEIAVRVVHPNSRLALDSGQSAVPLRNCTLVTFHLTVLMCHRCVRATIATQLPLAVPDTAALLPGSIGGLPAITVFTQQSASIGSARLRLGSSAVRAPHTRGIPVLAWIGRVGIVRLRRCVPVHLRGCGQLCHRGDVQVWFLGHASGYHRAARPGLRALHLARSEQIHAGHLLSAVAHLPKVVPSWVRARIHVSRRSKIRRTPRTALHCVPEVCKGAARGALVHVAERRRWHRIQAQGHRHRLAEFSCGRARTSVRGIRAIPRFIHHY